MDGLRYPIGKTVGIGTVKHFTSIVRLICAIPLIAQHLLVAEAVALQKGDCSGGKTHKGQNTASCNRDNNNNTNHTQ